MLQLSRTTFVLWAMSCLLAGAVAGCGRVGYELLPLLDGGIAAPTPDAASDDADSGQPSAPIDAGLDAAIEGALDAGRDAESDSGTVDAGPSCAASCSNDNGTAECSSGTCELSCTLGFLDCDRDPGNGCEADVASTLDSCGSCDTACENDHGSSACSAGLCTASCDASFDDCDENPDNGCETALTTTASCGACGVACTNAHGSTSCVSQACEPSCDSGYDDCDGNPNNGCETDILNDPSHCGSCPNACGSNGQVCLNGTCEASPCAPGLGECDGDLGVTCETDLTSDERHCGFCTNACMTANGTPACTASSCEVGACDTGYDDCDGDPADCEVNLTNTTAHCGACNAACTNDHGSTRCVGSSCIPTCSTGWDDCDDNLRNGCETPLDTVSNCGMCGRSCPANGGTAICTAGVCDTVCDLTGTFAVHARVYATWPATGGINGGNGWFDWWAKVDADHSGNSADVQVQLCGATVPVITAIIVGENMRFQYPNSLFDSGVLPVVASTMTLGDSTPDSSLTMPATAFMIGLSMSNPLSDPWPSTASGIPSANRIDMDGDGNPGVTGQFLNSGGYVYPRTSTAVFGFNRADRQYVAARTSFSLSGALSGCTEASGTATFPHIQVRVLGCRRSSGSACSASEANHLDTSSPPFTLSNGSYTMRKVADGASCATIRSTLP